ncbi:MAG: DNRLRE domain-containing protein, partial [Acidobacteriota bacterium]
MRHHRFTLSLIVGAVLCATLQGQTRLRLVASEPDREGWISTVSSGQDGCVPGTVDTASPQLLYGKTPDAPCGEYRSFLSFDLSGLDSGQVARAELVLYLTGAQGQPYTDDHGLELDLVNYGIDLGLGDWSVPAETVVSLGPQTSVSASELRVDVIQLLSYRLETGSPRLQFRLRLHDASTAHGFASAESSKSALQAFRPHLEVAVTNRVVAPTNPPGMTGDADPSSETGFVGVALANPNAGPNRIKTTFVDASGAQVKAVDRGLVTRQGQSAFILEPEQAAQMMTGRGTLGVLQGFFMFGEEDLSRLDGVGGELPESDRLWLPVSRGGPQTDTYLYLFRSSTGQPEQITLALNDTAGTRLEEASVTLPAPGFLIRSLRELFDSAAVPARASVSVEAPDGIRGLAVFSDGDALAALSLAQARPVTTLLAPHFFIGSAAGSELSLLNLEASAVQVRVTALDDAGDALAEAETQLPAHGLLSQDLGALLGLEASGDDLLTGHLRVDVLPQDGRANQVLGAIAFGSDDGSYLSVLPLVAEGRRETLVLQVAQSSALRIFTGLALLNPGLLATDVQIRVFAANGGLTAEKTVRLEAGRRIVDLLNGPVYFGPSFTQVGGHLEITSEQPLVTFAIFGDMDLRYLSAVEGQRATADYDAVEIEREICGPSDAGPTIVRLAPDPRQTGIPVFAPGTAVQIQVLFWDNSQEMSSLGGYRLGVA